MPRKQTDHRQSIRSYIDAWRRRGPNASEGDLYDVFATHIVRGILSYTADEYNITPRGQRGSGKPDLRLKTGDGTPWVAVEAKIDDRLIRSRADRGRLWADKRKYVDDETAYFLWVAPFTFLLCDAAGREVAGLRIENGQSELDLDLSNQVWHDVTSDAEVAAHLAPINAQAGRERKYLERFQAGDLPYGYIKVTGETVEKLTKGLGGCVDILLDYLKVSLARRKAEYDEYVRERPPYERELDDLLWIYVGDERAFRREIALRGFERKHARGRWFHEAFGDFCGEQAYTRFQKERNEDEQAALERIFRANAAYVAIGRLLFVRLAEDQGLIKPKISNGGLEAWNKVLDHGDLVAHWVGLAFADARRVCRQLFAETPFDVLLHPDEREFDQALLRVLFRLNAYDLSGLSSSVDVLGAIYQGILDRKLRKDLGEFYTDQEVVEYILSRVGLAEAARSGAQVRLLDPACGSGAFLVRAAGILREADAQRSLPKRDVQERIGAAIHGLDINHFAVYIADMNLLFSTFDLTAETRLPASFRVHCVNSLLRDLVTLDMTGGPSPERVTSVDDAAACRDATYGFVVGNPPYVRAERLPDMDRSELKRLYADVHGGGNVDLAVHFIRRALDWLEPDGRLGLILPRAIADSAFAEPLRKLLASDEYTLEELVPLDWACHELFDSDVVPFLLFLRKSPRPRAHKVTLVQGLRSKDDILARAAGRSPNGTRTSRIPWAAFQRHSDNGWPLEMTPEDLPLLDALKRFPRLASIAKASYGIKAGSTGAARDTAPGQRLGEEWHPMLTGAEIHAFRAEEPRRAVVPSTASDPSIWGTLLHNRGPSMLPEQAVAIPELHVTLNAAVIFPRSTCCQNNIVLLQEHGQQPHGTYAVAALLNSRCVRYFCFVALRSTVAGGGRRDYHLYPRTLEALPLPDLGAAGWSRLDRLSRVAHQSGATRAESDSSIWRRCATPHHSCLVREWPLDFGGWPDSAVLTAENYAPELDEHERELSLEPNISVRGDLPLLRYLRLHLDAYFDEAIELSKNQFMRQRVSAPTQVDTVLADFDRCLEARQEAEARYWKAVKLIDEIVERGFGLSRELRDRIARRMSEFPLSETANRPRLPWEESKKPRGRHFAAGERYHLR